MAQRIRSSRSSSRSPDARTETAQNKAEGAIHLSRPGSIPTFANAAVTAQVLLQRCFFHDQFFRRRASLFVVFRRRLDFACHDLLEVGLYRLTEDQGVELRPVDVPRLPVLIVHHVWNGRRRPAFHARRRRFGDLVRGWFEYLETVLFRDTRHGRREPCQDCTGSRRQRHNGAGSRRLRGQSFDGGHRHGWRRRRSPGSRWLWPRLGDAPVMAGGTISQRGRDEGRRHVYDIVRSRRCHIRLCKLGSWRYDRALAPFMPADNRLQVLIGAHHPDGALGRVWGEDFNGIVVDIAMKLRRSVVCVLANRPASERQTSCHLVERANRLSTGRYIITYQGQLKVTTDYYYYYYYYS